MVPTLLQGGLPARAGWPTTCPKVRLMRTIVVDHPLVAHKLTALRDERTDSPTFRRLVDQLVTLLRAFQVSV